MKALLWLLNVGIHYVILCLNRFLLDFRVQLQKVIKVIIRLFPILNLKFI